MLRSTQRLALLLFLLLLGCGPSRQDHMRSQNNLKQMMLSLHALHDMNGYVPAAIFDKEGKPLLSWRVAILPYIEQAPLYQQFKLDQPWDSPHNLALAKQMPRVYLITGVQEPNDTNTHYRIFVSDRKEGVKNPQAAAFSLIGPPTGPRGVMFGRMIDGLSTTLSIVESAEAVPWTKPEGIEVAPGKPLGKLADFWGGRANVAFFDGSVQMLPADVSGPELLKAITSEGGDWMQR
jgi:prepilin-type processing-associated H-X9-DG protein